MEIYYQTIKYNDFTPLPPRYDLGEQGFAVIGGELWIDGDNDDGTGGNGGFELLLATVATTSGVFDAADVTAGIA